MQDLHLYNVQKVRVDVKIDNTCSSPPPTPHHAAAGWSSLQVKAMQYESVSTSTN